MRLLMIASLGALAAGTAHASCENPSTQAEMGMCAGQALQKDDATLNTLYGQIQRRLKADSGTAKLFTASQRAWIAFRDAECEFSNSLSIGGTLHSMMVNTCADSLTLKRIDDFRGFLTCKEGDMACPVPEK